MRKQIAAANWKMNLTYKEGQDLLKRMVSSSILTLEGQEVVVAVPFPYLSMAIEALAGKAGFFTAGQNCSDKERGAHTGETSAEMLASMNVAYCIIGHSERREHYGETGAMLAKKMDLSLQYGLSPIFCCGEPLSIREAGEQERFVQEQLQDALFHLSSEQLARVVIAYEPVWAIGTGRTASFEQAQEMHAYIRSVIKEQWGVAAAEHISILYGGSVKGSNAAQLFSAPDVDGGLVGGASLVAEEFIDIIKALKNKT